MNNEIVVDGNDSQYLYAVPHDSSLCLIATSALIPTNVSAIYVVQPYGHLLRLHNDGQFQYVFCPIDIQVWSFWPWFASEIALLADGLPRFLKQNRSVRQAELFIFLLWAQLEACRAAKGCKSLVEIWTILVKLVVNQMATQQSPSRNPVTDRGERQVEYP